MNVMKDGEELEAALNQAMADCAKKNDVTVQIGELQRVIDQVRDRAFEEGKSKGFYKCFWTVFLCWLAFRIIEVIEVIFK